MDGNKKGVKEPIGTYEWKKELKRRLDIEKARKELPVYYYRIYRRTVFKLPVTNGWQNTLPVRYENIKPYPWEIWLMWSLRERWDTLLAGVVLDRDMEALDILQTELEVAFEWDTYAIGTDAYLGTAHFAMCVYRYLESGIFSGLMCNTPFLPENALCNAGSNERLRLIHVENLSADSETKIIFKLSVEN